MNEPTARFNQDDNAEFHFTFIPHQSWNSSYRNWRERPDQSWNSIYRDRRERPDQSWNSSYRDRSELKLQLSRLTRASRSELKLQLSRQTRASRSELKLQLSGLTRAETPAIETDESWNSSYRDWRELKLQLSGLTRAETPAIETDQSWNSSYRDGRERPDQSWNTSYRDRRERPGERPYWKTSQTSFDPIWTQILIWCGAPPTMYSPSQKTANKTWSGCTIQMRFGWHSVASARVTWQPPDLCALSHRSLVFLPYTSHMTSSAENTTRLLPKVTADTRWRPSGGFGRGDIFSSRVILEAMSHRHR